MDPADFLLIDVGNTTAKLRLARAAALSGDTRRLPTADLLARGGTGALRAALAGWNYRKVVLSSVVPAAGRVIEEALPDVFAVHGGVDSGVDLRGYPGAATLGSDRLANMAGALVRHGPPPLIVVDFGTAATFNVLAAQGRFLGGTIAPGLAAMAGILPARTALLPPVRVAGAAPKAIGRSTVAAVRAGALIGFRGMVREIVESLRNELGTPARVIATGGDAPFLATRLRADFDMVDRDLTLHGLRVIAARQHFAEGGGEAIQSARRNTVRPG